MFFAWNLFLKQTLRKSKWRVTLSILWIYGVWYKTIFVCKYSSVLSRLLIIASCFYRESQWIVRDSNRPVTVIIILFRHLNKGNEKPNLFLLSSSIPKTCFVYDLVSWSQIKIWKTHAPCSNTRKIVARNQVSRLTTVSQQPLGCGRNSIRFWNWSTCPPQPYLSASIYK